MGKVVKKIDVKQPNLFGSQLEVGQWINVRLDQLGNFSKGKGILKDQVRENGLPCIRYGEIYTSYNYVTTKLKSHIDENTAIESKKINTGSILFAGSGETADEIGKAIAYLGKEQAYAGGDIIVFEPNPEIADSEFLAYILDSDGVKRQKRVMGQGNAVVHIYVSDLEKLQIPLPPLSEQKAIAEVLGSMDEAIRLNDALLTQKQLRKQWLMQQLLSGHTRLPGFSGEWEEIKVKTFLTESKILSTHKDPNKRISVKLNLNGIEKREFKRNESEESTMYFIRKSGQFIYGKQNLHKGAFGIIPPHLDGYESTQDLPAFDFNLKKIIPGFFYFYLSQEKVFESLEKLATGTGSKRIHPESLFKVIINLPPLAEQQAIAEVLEAVDKELGLLRQRGSLLREQKKGMMQLLLTGKVRLAGG